VLYALVVCIIFRLYIWIEERKKNSLPSRVKKLIEIDEYRYPVSYTKLAKRWRWGGWLGKSSYWKEMVFLEESYGEMLLCKIKMNIEEKILSLKGILEPLIIPLIFLGLSLLHITFIYLAVFLGIPYIFAMILSITAPK